MPTKTRLSADELGRLLLLKWRREPRSSMTAWLKACGHAEAGSDLDRVLTQAQGDAAARQVCDRLIAEDLAELPTVVLPGAGMLATMIADIRLAMREQGMTQQDLADALEVTQPMISQYLNGKREPGARLLARIAEALGLRWTMVEP